MSVVATTRLVNHGTRQLRGSGIFSANYWYVSSSGATANPGTLASPWNLSYALTGAEGSIKPGDTIYIRGDSTYTGPWTTTVAGTASSRVLLRNYPGEHVVLSGNLVVNGPYAWFQGMELVSPTPTVGQVNGVNSRATGAKYINMVIHDASGTGVGLFDGADLVDRPGGEVYGCLLYNNGNLNNNDHGVYTDNNTGSKYVTDNIIFCNRAISIQAYATSPNQFIHNIVLDGNICFNSSYGGSGSNPPLEILYGGSGVQVSGGSVGNNRCYRTDHKIAVDIGWYFEPSTNNDMLFQNNYVVGGVEVEDYVTASILNNTIYADKAVSVYAQGVTVNRGTISGHVYSGNSWYCTTAVTGFGYKSASGPGAISGVTFGAWKTATGFSNPGDIVADTPSATTYFVRPNLYEGGRANIAIYNWALTSLVTVDVSSVLQTGDSFVVQNALDFYGSAVTSGTYAGAPITIPMTAVTPPAPIGRGTSGTTPGPTFGAFVLRKSGA